MSHYVSSLLMSPASCTCVHTLLSGLLIVPIFGSSVCNAGSVAANYPKPFPDWSWNSSFDPWYLTLLFLECI
ncbi:hypothetical protein H4582DRAFT_1996015 [Lactarius indigo]|nr:hypothetical protein H4582DRAFT_1996015 [Lactarius indigo]